MGGRSVSFAASSSRRRKREVSWEEAVITALWELDHLSLKSILESGQVEMKEPLKCYSSLGWGWGGGQEMCYGSLNSSPVLGELIKRDGCMEGDTLLHLAVKTRSEKVIKIVMDVDCGDTAKVENRWGVTAFDTATRSKIAHLLTKQDWEWQLQRHEDKLSSEAASFEALSAHDQRKALKAKALAKAERIQQKKDAREWARKEAIWAAKNGQKEEVWLEMEEEEKVELRERMRREIVEEEEAALAEGLENPYADPAVAAAEALAAEMAAAAAAALVIETDAEEPVIPEGQPLKKGGKKAKGKKK
jgi:hypothetical protein